MQEQLTNFTSFPTKVQYVGKLLKIDVVDNLSKEQIAEQFDTEQNKFSEADGFYKDGKIYINKEVAKETRAVSVGRHAAGTAGWKSGF